MSNLFGLHEDEHVFFLSALDSGLIRMRSEYMSFSILSYVVDVFVVRCDSHEW